MTRGIPRIGILASCEFIGNPAVKIVALDSLKDVYGTVL